MHDKPDIFISYKRERRDLAARLAKDLEAAGYSVFYDINLVHGDEFADQLDAKLRAADLVVVLWTEDAVTSDWVRREARFAAELDRYFPVHFDKVDLPVDLRGRHAVEVADGEDFSNVVSAVLDRLPFAEVQVEAAVLEAEIAQTEARLREPVGVERTALPELALSEVSRTEVPTDPKLPEVALAAGLMILAFLSILVADAANQISIARQQFLLLMPLAGCVAIVALVLKSRQSQTSLRLKKPLWVFLRALLVFFSALAIVWSIPVSGSTGLMASIIAVPLLVTAFCFLGMGARPGAIYFAALTLGVLGGAVVFWVNGFALSIGLFFGVISGGCYAGAVYITHARCQDENPLTLAVTERLALILGGGLSYLGSNGNWAEVSLNDDIFLMLLAIPVGALLAFVSWAIARAYQIARPDLIVPLEYARLLVAAVILHVLFGVGLSLLAAVGLILILIALALTLTQTRVRFPLPRKT